MNNRDYLELLNGKNNLLGERLPVREKASGSDLVFAKRKVRIAIREACIRQVSAIILYKKVDGTLNKYEVGPISYRYRELKTGRRKVLFAQDIRSHRQIKYFVLKNIYKVVLTDRHFIPSYKVEII